MPPKTKNNSKKKKPRQGPNLDKAFGSNINDIISNLHNVHIIIDNIGCQLLLVNLNPEERIE